VRLLILASLLVLPVYAGWRMGAAFHWFGVYALVLSAVTYWVYAMDKRRAEAGEWRVPEVWLHFLELLSGWPGAFLAQGRLRHKCSKTSYQFVFWLIVLIYQFVAFDSLRNWQLSRAVLPQFDAVSEHRR
jgi:uncharacterized membrane protein YsdA (DUF1294 family)